MRSYSSSDECRELWVSVTVEGVVRQGSRGQQAAGQHHRDQECAGPSHAYLGKFQNHGFYSSLSCKDAH